MKKTIVTPLLAICILTAGCGGSDTESTEAETTTTEAKATTTVAASSAGHVMLDESGELAVGEIRLATNVPTHCGLAVIYRPIAGTLWEVVEPIDTDIPDEWLDQVSGDEISLVVELVEDDRLEVTALDSTLGLTYQPAENPPLCD